MVNFGLQVLSRWAKFFHKGYLTHFCRSATKFGRVNRNLANLNLFPEFCELRSGCPVIPCGDMHQTFTDALVKWFLDNFPTLADSFGLVLFTALPVVRGYRCTLSVAYKLRRASRSSSLRQHGFLVISLPRSVSAYLHDVQSDTPYPCRWLILSVEFSWVHRAPRNRMRRCLLWPPYVIGGDYIFAL